MPVSGLVVTLAQPGPQAELAAAWMQGDARFVVGEPEPTTPRRLPVTLDTADRDEDKHLWEQMQDHPGIDFVDVACVFFEDVVALPSADAIEDAHAQPIQARSRPW